MTIINWCGIAFFVMSILVGGITKKRTYRTVKGLQGIKGFVKKREKTTNGNIVVQFGE